MGFQDDPNVIQWHLHLNRPPHEVYEMLSTAAIIVRQWITREGFGDAGLRPNLRSKWPYYLVAWLLPLPVGA